MHYLYRHIRLDTNEVFYIGIGTKPSKSRIHGFNTEYPRAYEKSKRTDFWKNIVSKTDYIVEIIMESPNKDFICQKEIEFIKLYGRKFNNTGTLVNFDEGGNLNTCSKNYGIRITQLDLYNKVIKIWSEVKDIQNTLGFLKTNIVKCCRKKQLSAYGYKWEYTDDRSYDHIYPTAARKKSSNNRVGLTVIDTVSNTIYKFRTATEAAEKFKYDRTTIQRYLSGKAEHKTLIFKWNKWLK